MAKYFTLKELCASSKAVEYGIDNFPTFEIAEHLGELADQLLDPLRIAWGSAIRVTSGYRCTRLNNIVGGAPTSAHKRGYAADLQPVNGKTEDFINFTKTWVQINRIKFDQFIREQSEDGKKVWLHLGLYNSDGQQRGQFLNLVKK